MADRDLEFPTFTSFEMPKWWYLPVIGQFELQLPSDGEVSPVKHTLPWPCPCCRCPQRASFWKPHTLLRYRQCYGRAIIIIGEIEAANTVAFSRFHAAGASKENRDKLEMGGFHTRFTPSLLSRTQSTLTSHPLPSVLIMLLCRSGRIY